MPDRGSPRLEALAREYELLRQHDRSYPAVMVGMASAAAVIGGTSVFFLLRGCGFEDTATCTPYPHSIYMLLPAPRWWSPRCWSSRRSGRRSAAGC